MKTNLARRKKNRKSLQWGLKCIGTGNNYDAFEARKVKHSDFWKSDFCHCLKSTDSNVNALDIELIHLGQTIHSGSNPEYSIN